MLNLPGTRLKLHRTGNSPLCNPSSLSKNSPKPRYPSLSHLHSHPLLPSACFLLVMKIEACDRDDFELAGPTHLSHKRLGFMDKRAVIAALVQAVYVAESDRQQKRHGGDALACKWWNEFGYEPISFVHEQQQSEPITGIVFERTANGRDVLEGNEGKEEDENCLPSIVVALRGTMWYHSESLQKDLLANFYVISHQLHTTERFTMALESIREAINKVGSENVTITGHSLGAAIALLAGQTLAAEGVFIDAHLFNPPFLSPPLERIKSRGWRLILNLTGMACATSLSHLLLDAKRRQTSSQAFFALKRWHPHIYVNVEDSVCSSYVSYFNSHGFMQQIGAGALAQLAAPISFQGTIQQYFFGDCKAFYLIPCAHLHVVKKMSAKLVRAHGLHQWWWEDLEVDYEKASVGMDERTTDVPRLN